MKTSLCQTSLSFFLFFYPSKEPCSWSTFPKGRQMQTVPLCLPLVTTSKRKWEGASCSGFLALTSSFQCLSLASLIFINNNVRSLSPHLIILPHHKPHGVTFTQKQHLLYCIERRLPWCMNCKWKIIRCITKLVVILSSNKKEGNDILLDSNLKVLTLSLAIHIFGITSFNCC
jgi:hypothetical protein